MEMTGMEYMCSGGDTFDSIALYIYEDERYAPELMMANPKYSNVGVFKGGERVLIPVVEDKEEQERYTSADAPWRR